jgi:hypothetical protein
MSKTINIDREPPLVLNFSNLEDKRRFMSHVGTLQGLYEVQLKPRKRTRTLDQNSYYWAAYIPGWLEWYRRNEGDPTITGLDAHYALMAAVLPPVAIVNRETGEVVEGARHRSSKMTVEEFSVYLDKARMFLESFCGLVILEAELFSEAA